MSPIVLILIVMFVLEYLKDKDAKRKKEEEFSPLEKKPEKKKGFFDEIKKEYYKMKSELELEGKQSNSRNRYGKEKGLRNISVSQSEKQELERFKTETQNNINREKREEFERIKYLEREKRDSEKEKEKSGLSVEINRENMKENVVLGVIFSEILGEPKSRSRRK